MTVPYMPRWDTGPNEDPLAALIGKGLQAFGAVKTARQQEADRERQLARQDAQEQDTRNWRDLQSGVALANAGLTTEAPKPTITDTPASDVGLTPPTVTPAQPVERVGGMSLYRGGPSAAETKATEIDDRQRVIHRRVGHALAQQMFGHDVDDDTAEGIGTNPAAFSSFQRAQEPKYTPVHGPSGEVLAFDPTKGTARSTGTTVGQAQSFGGMGGVTGREAQAAAKAVHDAAGEMAALYAKDKQSPITPRLSAGVRGMGNAPIVGGLVRGFTEGQANAMLSPNQRQFQKAADRMLHNIGSLLPKGGRSTAILQNLRHSFVPSAGEDDPETVRRTVEAAQQIADLYARAIAGQPVDIFGELEGIAAGQGTAPVSPATPPVVPPPVTPPPVSHVPNFQKFSTRPAGTP